MSVEIESERSMEAEELVTYRPLSAVAVASLILGVLSIAALLDWIMIAIPVIGLVLAIAALRLISARAGEVSGARCAWLGLGLSLFFLVAGPARLYYVYATELPPNHLRIDYSYLKPDPDIPSQIMPPDVIKLDGQKVFIKGYPLGGTSSIGIKKFILCRDMGQCCFGGNPPLTDQVEVQLMGSLKLNYELRLLKLAGTFHVRPPQPGPGPQMPVYFLEADHLE